MKRLSRVSTFLLAACIFGAVLLCGPATVCADESYNIPEGVHIDLDKDFYRALGNSQKGSKFYTTDPSRIYLQMILKNQEEIMKKLDLLLDRKQ